MAIRNTNLGGTNWVEGSDSLDGALNDSDTTITVIDASGFQSTGTILIESELISYTGTTGTTFTGCTRGFAGTTKASHIDTTAVTETEILLSADMNDTMDALYAKVIDNPAFWLNSDLYTVYDDFNTETVGAFTSNAKWTIANTEESTTTIAASTNAGGTTRELVLSGIETGGGATTAHSSATAIALVANRHVWCRLQFVGTIDSSSAPSCTVTFASGTERTITTTSTTYHSIFLLAKGSDLYDLYIGGKLIEADIDGSADNTLELRAYGPITGKTGTLYVDDVRYSNTDVS